MNWKSLPRPSLFCLSSRETTAILAMISNYRRSESCANFTSRASVLGLRTAPICMISFAVRLSSLPCAALRATSLQPLLPTVGAVQVLTQGSPHTSFIVPSSVRVGGPFSEASSVGQNLLWSEAVLKMAPCLGAAASCYTTLSVSAHLQNKGGHSCLWGGF